MKAYRIIIAAFLLFCTLLSCIGCSSSTSPLNQPITTDEITADNCDITVNLDAVEDLTVTPNLVSQFYTYYRENRYELTYLPDFSAENNEPDWDDLSLYIMLRFEQSPTESQLTKESFKETMLRCMQPVKYTDGPSYILDYTNGVYIASGFDLNGSTHYRLINLTRDEQNLYTATFDTLFFEETERAFPETSPNTRAIVDYAINQFDYTAEEVLSSGPKFNNARKSIFLRDDYAEILDMSGTITIQFTLTGDPDNPFYYVSCKRAPGI